MRFHVGARVQLKGLAKAAEHNGKYGSVVGYQGERYMVKLLGEEKTMAVKEANLEKVVDGEEPATDDDEKQRRNMRCDQCGAVLDPTKVLRCIRCKACFYCSAACQKQNWKRIHKRVCTTEPALQRFVRVEMAVERVLAKQPKVQVPKDATCYICLEGEDGGKLLRGCACRGDSAGFVHVDCLEKLAKSKDASEDLQAMLRAWNQCVNCKQDFTGALDLSMARRWWRCHRSGGHRSSSDLCVGYNALNKLALFLGNSFEIDAASQLYDEAAKYTGDDFDLRLDLTISKARMLQRNGPQKALEALKILQVIVPQAKQQTLDPVMYCDALDCMAEVQGLLGRSQEANKTSIELVAFTKAQFGTEDSWTRTAMKRYAMTCADLGRRDESKATFEDVLRIETQILGRDHRDTQATKLRMQIYGFPVPH